MLPGAFGRCLPTPYGQKDPKNKCLVKPACDEDGRCDGNGKCRKYISGTSCGPNLCKDETSSSGTKLYSCDGAGKCVETLYSCGNYRCAASLKSCLGRCTSSSHCVGTMKCISGKCTP